MIDTQNKEDLRGLALSHVGIKNFALPLSILTKKKKSTQVAGIINLFADLPHTRKGHHLSRFVEVLQDNHEVPLSVGSITKIVEAARERLESADVYFEVEFTYFLPKKSPVSKKESYSNYECKFISEHKDNKYSNRIVVNVPVMLLCPCSKAISKYNAHNQRSIIKVEVETDKDIWLEDIIEIVENEGSCKIYPILKRVDEKHVTEFSYENPKFVEDTVRDVALKVKKIKGVKSLSVECESQESIHNHNAYAKYSSNER